MDIDKFCIDFFEKNKNSKTATLLNALKNACSVEDTCRIVDNAVSWGATSEGYYYFYILQIRLALELATAFYKEGNLARAMACYKVYQAIYNYTYEFNPAKVGSIKIDRRRYFGLKIHYDRIGKHIHREILAQKDA